MDEAIRSAVGNELRFEVKRPNGLMKKWSSASCKIKCGNCGSTEIESSNAEGPLIVTICFDCKNYNWIEQRKVFKTYDSEEAFISTPEYFDRVK